MALRVVAGTLGLFFLVQALNWVAAPGAAAAALGMPLLEGAALSTQIGDLGGFFFSLGTLVVLGAYRSNPHLLRAGALLLGSVAVMRTLAWLLHDAAFTMVFIGVEVVSVAVLLFVASRFEAIGASASPDGE